MTILSLRKTFFYLFILACGFLTFDAIAYVGGGAEDCASIYVERLLMLVLAVIFLMGAIQQETFWGRKIYSISGIVFSLLGAVVAGNHIFIQHLSPQQLQSYPHVSSQTLSFFQLVSVGFTGTANCATVTWGWFGLGFSSWAFFLFIVFVLVLFWQLIRKVHSLI